ncbi:MAG: thymidylate kinase [Chloracidobacterium sp.]|uniref:Thymidylate kinase n=1 Tax=Chloracidobacterium validum TaxID=2821543 RepID=A0ABX8BAW7_9BACT|nr:thymidylate kinase [Chloracidobacterium validum]QUW02690.1 thymidylate kinase [Chloracidobacterium validum]
MTKIQFFGAGLPGFQEKTLPGRLIVLEGTDGVGRSTQIALLKTWLESSGFAVLDTGLTRSLLAGRGLKKAKEGHTLGAKTMDLFYATDLADRLENQMIPALRAGFIVLTDRYVYSLMARAIVRGASSEWIQSVYGFALKPDAVFYLKIDLSHLIPRVLTSTGFDYWESGMDFLPGDDMYDCFVQYQTRLLATFDQLARQHGFETVDATQTVNKVFSVLQRKIQKVLPKTAPVVNAVLPTSAAPLLPTPADTDDVEGRREEFARLSQTESATSTNHKAPAAKRKTVKKT